MPSSSALLLTDNNYNNNNNTIENGETVNDDETFHALFGSISSIGPCLGKVSCSLNRLPGTFYMARKSCYFYQNIVGLERKVILPYQDIIKLQLLRNTSICFTMFDGETFIFRSFQNRYAVLDALQRLQRESTIIVSSTAIATITRPITSQKSMAAAATTEAAAATIAHIPENYNNDNVNNNTTTPLKRSPSDVSVASSCYNSHGGASVVTQVETEDALSIVSNGPPPATACDGEGDEAPPIFAGGLCEDDAQDGEQQQHQILNNNTLLPMTTTTTMTFQQQQQQQFQQQPPPPIPLHRVPSLDASLFPRNDETLNNHDETATPPLTNRRRAVSDSGLFSFWLRKQQEEEEEEEEAAAASAVKEDDSRCQSFDSTLLYSRGGGVDINASPAAAAATDSALFSKSDQQQHDQQQSGISNSNLEQEAAAAKQQQQIAKAWETAKASKLPNCENTGLECFVLSACPSLELFFQTFLADQAPFSVGRFQETVLGDNNVHLTGWEEVNSNNNNNNADDGTVETIRRTMTFVHKIQTSIGLLGPSEAHTTRQQTLKKYPGYGMLLQSSTTVKGVPYADTFYVQDQWVIEQQQPSSSPCVVLSTRFGPCFTKRCLWRSIIEKSVVKETNDWFASFSNYLVAAIKETNAEAKNKEMQQQLLQQQTVVVKEPSPPPANALPPQSERLLASTTTTSLEKAVERLQQSLDRVVWFLLFGMVIFFVSMMAFQMMFVREIVSLAREEVAVMRLELQLSVMQQQQQLQQQNQYQHRPTTRTTKRNRILLEAEEEEEDDEISASGQIKKNHYIPLTPEPQRPHHDHRDNHHDDRIHYTQSHFQAGDEDDANSDDQLWTATISIDTILMDDEKKGDGTTVRENHDVSYHHHRDDYHNDRIRHTQSAFQADPGAEAAFDDERPTSTISTDNIPTEDEKEGDGKNVSGEVEAEHNLAFTPEEQHSHHDQDRLDHVHDSQSSFQAKAEAEADFDDQLTTGTIYIDEEKDGVDGTTRRGQIDEYNTPEEQRPHHQDHHHHHPDHFRHSLSPFQSEAEGDFDEQHPAATSSRHSLLLEDEEEESDQTDVRD